MEESTNSRKDSKWTNFYKSGVGGSQLLFYYKKTFIFYFKLSFCIIIINM
ncbi:hypothetical protein BN1095_460016 [Clostridioides difficile]|uniref:Uncharacterized protein n=1 Tax=Clostridioides difficile TaxID=1496 RepID=A0A069AR62_CLODI|nr:hypothetical protein BN165_1830071 [Clostridioides difficile E1]CCL08808.1 hypothetical protein BN168_670073 [Clostridioides difficile CD002]CCL19955.1 hypothetical protein BN171_3600033 [Clostridioides difficile E25]CCL47788.1 hypothetical protein BN178_830072 [Clostridioides difficile T42]CCL62576.1 hypothetical protein BN182_2790034 [Clostridioides difficile E9]CCL70497.1 hypothetical protein BN184_2570033 [Clostridioides difficile T3]CCL77903.1 hypothetical protein BN186_2130033 [Clost